MANIIVAAEEYRSIDGQLHEIKRQLRQEKGYPFDPQQLTHALQAIIEGRFGEENTLTHILDYTVGPGLIKHLKRKGAFTWSSPEIDDDQYLTNGTGKVNVKFRILRGVDLKRPDGYVYRTDVGAAFLAKGMRCPRPEEALLVPAEDQEIGHGNHPLVAFIYGSDDAFIVRGDDNGRDLRLKSDSGSWNLHYDFLGVCE